MVEDQDELRSLILRTLAGEGYRVLTARDGVEALEVLEAESDVSLIVTDVVMPRMNGFDLAERLSSRIPAPRILFMSGYGQYRTEMTQPFLQKPFTPAELCHHVQRLLLPAQPQV